MILGSADYGNFLVVFQNVMINADNDENGNAAPKLGKGLFMGAGSKIIGNRPVGDRVSIGVDAVIYNQKVENDKVVIKKQREKL